MKTELTVGIIGVLLVAVLTTVSVSVYRDQQQSAGTSVVPLSNTAVTGTALNANTSSTVALTAATVAQHSTGGDCWLIISGKVYGVSSYLRLHPGGSAIIVPYCGRDATAAFATQGGRGQHSGAATQQLAGYLLGALNETVPASATSQSAATPTLNTTSQSGGNEQEDD